MIAAMDSGMVYLLVVLCLVILSMSMLRRSQQRRATARDLTREQLARLRDQGRIRESMEELLLQLEEVSRRISAQVDTRFAKLEAVIRDADERIARLESLKAAPGRNNPHAVGPGTTAGAKPPVRAAEDAVTATPRARNAGNDNAGHNDGDSFRPGITPAAHRPETAPPPTGDTKGAARPDGAAPRPAGREERRQRVYELADAGTSAMTIADMLQIPLGEVELLLNLRGFK